MTCAEWRCDDDTLPHMEFCYDHVPRYEIPPHDELECPNCGATGPHGTLSDSTYYCKECDELFDPRRFADSDPRSGDTAGDSDA